jgi:protein-L-isoaspartate(D-aspartate) O-methyltransferase
MPPVAEEGSEALRGELVEALRTAGHLRDDGVAAAFASVPRELFLADHVERHGLADAYRDAAIVTRTDPATGEPLSSSSQPAIMARMLEMLGVREGDRVLEVGAGTGYNAALLAQLVGERGAVTSVELDADTAVAARRALVSAGVPARVEVGDGAGGWPSAAPVDAVIVTASTPVLPQAWFDQLRPGGRLVVPLRVSAVVGWPQAVVAFRKARRGFEQVAITAGGFMPLRDGGTRPPRGRAAHLTVRDVAGGEGGPAMVDMTGPALAGLDAVARQRLVVTLLGFGRHRPLPLGGGSAMGLLAYVTLALPEERLVEVTRRGTRAAAVNTALGVVDAVDGGVAVLASGPGGRAPLRLDAYGAPGAEGAVLSAVERWTLAGRPAIDDATFTVRYGPERPDGWRTLRRQGQWIALDWSPRP